MSNIGDTDSIRKWINEGGSVSSEEQIEKDFSILELNVLACDIAPASTDNLRQIVDKFINEHKAKLPDLFPPKLLNLTDKLLDLGLASAACELLKPHIPTTDIWESPLVNCYLRALLDSQQMMSLSSILSEIDQGEWSSHIWQILARQLDSQHNYPDAIEAIEAALNQEPLSLYSWYILINLHKKCGSDDNLIAATLSRIPDVIFTHQSSLGFILLTEMITSGDFVKSEEFLISWFIENPEECAIPLTNVYFTALIDGHPPTTVSNSTKHCTGGVKYSSNGEVITKLLVTDEVKLHHCLLRTSSPLGTLLSSMKPGEVQEDGMQDIELIEYLPPFVAAFRIATDLRQAMNDGLDSFHLINLPKDPDKLFEFLEKKLFSSDKSKEILESNPAIPLFMKGHRQFPSSPIKAALHHLTSKTSIKAPLPNFGEDNPDQMILDAYSIIYLALTGLVYGLAQLPIKLLLTNETNHYMKMWLEDVNRDDYLSIGVHPDGGLFRNTSDDIQQITADIQDAVNTVLSLSEIVTPKLVDIPPEILKIQELVDQSVLSSLKLSITNDLAWLCIDETFANLSKATGYKTANSFLIFNTIGQKLPLNLKQKGIYLHVTADLPYPLLYDDMILLSKSDEDHAHYFLAELLNKHSNSFSNTDDAIKFLHSLIVSILLNQYAIEKLVTGLQDKNSAHNGYVEQVFNVCCHTSMQCKDGMEAENKLALLLSRLFHTFLDSTDMKRLINVMASRFISGHFLSLSTINKHINEINKFDGAAE